jgi:cytochrome c oxidase subunit 2
MNAKADSKADFDSFGKMPQADDIHVVNELHIWQDNQVIVYLTTRDVIHSFNLPHFRVKQDALPGKMIPVWFRTIDSAERKTHNVKWDGDRCLDGYSPETKKKDNDYTYDLACAELCGWGHYRMIGRVYVHENREDFLKWLKIAEKTNRQRTRD